MRKSLHDFRVNALLFSIVTDKIIDRIHKFTRIKK